MLFKAGTGSRYAINNRGYGSALNTRQDSTRSTCTLYVSMYVSCNVMFSLILRHESRKLIHASTVVLSVVVWIEREMLLYTLLKKLRVKVRCAPRSVPADTYIYMQLIAGNRNTCLMCSF